MFIFLIDSMYSKIEAIQLEGVIRNLIQIGMSLIEACKLDLLLDGINYFQFRSILGMKFFLWNFKLGKIDSHCVMNDDIQ